MENITELVHCRRSVRTFDGKEVNEDDMEKLVLYMEKIENPYGILGLRQMLIQNILHRICSRSRNIIKNRRIFQ